MASVWWACLVFVEVTQTAAILKYNRVTRDGRILTQKEQL